MGAYEYNPLAPMADAGPNQTVDIGDTVTLDGSNSSDPEGETLTYLWTQTGGTIVTLSDATAVQPTFTAPVVVGGLIFQLTVTNTSGLKNTDNVGINVVAITPTVTTAAVSSITSTSASSGGNVTSDSGASVTVRGVCWSTSANPTISNSHTMNGTGTGTFTRNITTLIPGTLYHVRAYATKSQGTAYGSDLTFTTSNASQCPECSIDPVILKSVRFRSGTVCECSAATSITIGPNVIIEDGATVVFKSRKVVVKPGVDIQAGAVVKTKQW